MIAKETRVLWYIVHDDSASHTSLDIHCDCNIDHLKKIIHTQRDDIPVSGMTLWKVTKSMCLPHLTNEIKIPDEDFEEARAGSGGLQYLDSVLPVSFYWSEQPEELLFHLIVQLTKHPAPIPWRSASQPRHLGAHVVRRTELVNLLDQRLSEYRIIQIRGTPASGKSTLCNLLHIHLKNRNALVYTIDGWRTDKHHMERLHELCGPFHPTHPTYLLFDAAEDTYYDDDLWNFFFKSLRSMGNMYVALFCSYGSASCRIMPATHGRTSDVFDKEQRFLLLPTAETPLGLHMTCEEFEDLLSRYPHMLNLSDEVKKEILKWSAGHIGCIEYLLDSIRFKNSAAMNGDTIHELTKFLDDHTPSIVGRGFCYASGGRGLPDPEHDLKIDPSMTAMFRQLLRDGQLLEKDQPKFGDAVEKAHKRGYIYAKLLASSDQQCFVLPTPLHAVSLSWMLVPSQTVLPFDLNTLVWEVVTRFKYSQLALPVRRAGLVTTSHELPEAQYRDEFYRALHDLTNGSILVSPEFASASDIPKAGRIDFYIASKKWGIEITRDGKKLQEHSDRFGPHGAYGRWLSSGDVSDYILLDCRSTKPTKHHSTIPNLFHAVFNQCSVAVYNNRCEELFTKPLWENH